MSLERRRRVNVVAVVGIVLIAVVGVGAIVADAVILVAVVFLVILVAAVDSAVANGIVGVDIDGHVSLAISAAVKRGVTAVDGITVAANRARGRQRG